MAKLKVQTACRDCSMCTGHAFTGAGRSLGRGAADLATLGVAHLARRSCKMCGHPMSEHQAQGTPMVAIGDSNPPRWVRQEDRRYRWWNGECWTDYHTNYPTDAASVTSAMAAFVDNPPKWIKQDDGRLRWWAGENFTDDWKDDPTVEAELGSAPKVSVADEIRKLAELHREGLLTDDEFADAKKRVLAS